MSMTHILVVDDEPHTRNFICDGLSALGIADDALGVATAEDALIEIKNRQPALIITDVRMPGLNGLDLARYIRQTYPDIKVIVVTGYSTRDIEKTALALSVTALLRKPFGLETLGEVVRQALSPAAPSRVGPDPSALILEPLQRQINILKRDTGAMWVALLGTSGQVIVQSEAVSELSKLTDNAAFQSWSYMLSQIREHGGPGFLYVENQPYDVYLGSVDAQHSLTLVYDRRWQTNRIGAVWLTTKQALPEFSRLLARQISGGAGFETTPTKMSW